MSENVWGKNRRKRSRVQQRIAGNERLTRRWTEPGLFFFSFLIVLGPRPRRAQKLSMALHSGIYSGKFRRSCGMQGMKFELTTCKCLIYCTITLTTPKDIINQCHHINRTLSVWINFIYGNSRYCIQPILLSGYLESQIKSCIFQSQCQHIINHTMQLMNNL